MARRYTIDSVQLANHHTRFSLSWTAAGREGAGKKRGRMEGGRKGARRGWEGGREHGDGGRKGGERGSDDARQGESASGRLREGRLMKGTNEEGTERGLDSPRERGREEARGGWIGRGEGSKGGKGAREGGKLQGMYPQEGTGQCTVCSQTIPQRGPCPLDFGITNEK